MGVEIGIFFERQDAGEYWHYVPKVNIIILPQKALALTIVLTLGFVLSAMFNRPLAYLFGIAIMGFVIVATLYKIEVYAVLGPRTISAIIPDKDAVSFTGDAMLPIGIGFRLKKSRTDKKNSTF